MDARRLLFPAFFFTLCSCTEAQAPKEPSAPQVAPNLARDFQEDRCGSIHGQVTWCGPHLIVPPLNIFGVAGFGIETNQERDNPHVPRIDEAGGIADAVVYLRGVDLEKSRPWHHPPVRVEQLENRIQVKQGEVTTATGFVKRGATIEVVNRDSHLHVLRVGGADFFSLHFPDKDMPRRRQLLNHGVLELSSGAGYFWMSAHLFVGEHPYFTRTDSKGRFLLDKVPAGTYRLVCWLPHWKVLKSERDPESGLVHRILWRAPVEREVQVHAEAGKSTKADWSWLLSDFGARAEPEKTK